MGSNRTKRISIHDYPEHLNPFSEPNLTVQDKRRIFVDKLRKNGTWSSKISKRVSRSVTWIEKSWLASEEPPKGYTDNRIDDKHNIRTRKYDTRMCVKSNPVIKEVPPTEHDSVARHDGYQRPHTREPHELDDRNKIATTDCEFAKLETKKRKKRPAPLPPNITDTSSSPSEEKPTPSFSSQTKVDEIARNSEDTSRTEVVMENSDHCESNDVENKNDTPVSNIAEENHEVTELVSSPTEESSGKALAEAPQVSDHLERLHLDSSENNDSQKSSETSESERLEILANGTCNIEKVEQENMSSVTSENSVLDENANISCSKLERKVSDSTVKIHCNGNAVQV